MFSSDSSYISDEDFEMIKKYVTDRNDMCTSNNVSWWDAITEETFPLLEGITDIVVDALRWKAHPTHFNILQAEDAFHRIGARRAWLTHLTHDILYERDRHFVAPGCTLAYDGLSFDFDLE